MADETTTQQAADDLQMEVVPPAAPPAPAATNSAAAAKKVELDLDDAPFMGKDEEAPPQPPAKKQDAPPAKAEKKADPPDKKARKKKLMIIAGAAAAVLLIGGVAAWWLLSGGSGGEAPADAPPPTDAPPVEPEVIVVPTQKAPVIPAENMRALEPFWVENIDTNGSSHFMVCSFAIVSDDATADMEVAQKKLVIRDAIYFYLRSKTFEMLLDGKHTEAMKKDLVDIVNNYMSRSKVKDVLFERYIRQ